MSETPSRNEESTQPQARRLGWLDGLRGLAALYVVLFHVRFFSTEVGKPDESSLILNHGRYAVTLFLLLSGYSLFLPVIRTWNKGRDWAATGAELRAFFGRRARRILPAFWASVVLYLALIPTGYLAGISPWRGAGGHPTPRDIVSNLLLVNNWIPTQNSAVCGVYWSLAIEAQIYLLMPFMVWAWRRRGIVWPLLACASLGLVMDWNIASPFLPLIVSGLHLDLVLVFFLGGVAAWIATSEDAGAVYLRTSIPWLVVGAVGAVNAVFMLPDMPERTGNWLITATLFVPLLVCCTRHRVMGDIFGCGILRRLGTISYSLYLVHMAVIAVVIGQIVRPHPEMSDGAAGWTALFAVPLSIALATALYFLAERPFLARPGAANPEPAPATATPLPATA